MVYINDEYKFIFIDNPKSGSTSLTNALREALGTKIERKSPKEVHLTSKQIKELYPDKWNTYTKVTTFREPLRRFGSAVNYGSHYFNNYTNIQELEQHIITQKETCVFCLPQEAFTDGCDVIIHIDQMQKDFDNFCTKIGIKSVKVPLANKKDTTRKFFNLDQLFKKLY